jgi:hypothetical protein
MTKRQHRIAIAVLKQIGLDNIRLERSGDSYRFIAWSVLFIPIRILA